MVQDQLAHNSAVFRAGIKINPMVICSRLREIHIRRNSRLYLFYQSIQIKMILQRITAEPDAHPSS
jgi:hypothetical protein